jgi:hypothetical protein
MQGWVKLHRKLLDNWIISEPEALAVWIRFMLEANHESKTKMFNGAMITIRRGQLIFGLEAFSSKNNISISKLRRYLKLFENDGMINRQKTNKYSVITLLAYDEFQKNDKLDAGKRQASEQANDRQAAIPKELKKERIKERDKRFTPPTLQEVQQYCLERSNSVNPENFLDHYESVGWLRGKNKIKDWKACVRTWEKNTKPKPAQMPMPKEFPDDY